MADARFKLTVRLSSVAALLLFVLTAGVAQHSSGMPRGQRHESRHEIDQLEQTWRDAVISRNVSALDSLLAEDYIAITANGTLLSKEQTLTNLRSGTQKFASIEFSDRKVRFYGKTALVTSRAEINASTGEGNISGSYRYTRVWVKDATGVWKIVSFEASRIRDSEDHK